MSVKASAPGKLVLFGEHAVLYEYPCIITAVDLRYYALVERQETSRIVIKTPTLSLRNDSFESSVSDILELRARQPEIAFVIAAIRQFYQKYNISSGLDLSTSGPLISYGLGSSSAITVATIAAMAELYEISLDKMSIFDLAYSAVLDVQGKGSGFDVAAAVFGGTILYKLGENVVELDVKELPIVIGYSGRKVSTSSYIGRVSDLRDRQPNVLSKVFDLMGDIVDRAKTALLETRWVDAGVLMNINQGLLDSLDISTSKLAKLIFSARESGAYGAKLSGAGGGDCMYAIADFERLPAIRTGIRQAGGEVVAYSPNAQGVRIEDVQLTGSED